MIKFMYPSYNETDYAIGLVNFIVHGHKSTSTIQTSTIFVIRNGKYFIVCSLIHIIFQSSTGKYLRTKLQMTINLKSYMRVNPEIYFKNSNATIL